MNMDLGDTRLIINECKKRGVLRNQTAYLLATTAIETNLTMKPVKEAYWLPESARRKYFHKMYDINGSRPRVAKMLGNTEPGDGARFPGNGYTQPTGRSNYGKLSKATGVDLIAEPERALEPEIAVVALIEGALQGWWTGRKLGRYINLNKSDFYNARRVVNGLDRAQKIADLAAKYDEALLQEGYGVEDVKAIPVPTAKPKLHKSLTESKELLGALTLLLGAVGKFFEQIDGNTLMMIAVAAGFGFAANRLYARWKGER